MKNTKRKKNTREVQKSVVYGEFICPKCGLPITEVTQAITDSVSKQPMHFDCAREIILESETLPENAELTYLGKGTFGIVQFEDANPRNRKSFKIIKTFNFEEPTVAKEWRDGLKETFDKTLN